MPLSVLTDGRPAPTFDSFIAGVGESAALEDLARLRCGAPLRLRRAARPSRGSAYEILAQEGGRLGWLPPDDAEVLEASGLDPAMLTARVAAIVPAFQRPRIRIAILLPDQPTQVAPAA